MKKNKKLLFASSVITASVFAASICAYGAQIDSLSVADNTVYATVDTANSRLYAAEYDEGLLVDAFFSDADSTGNIKVKIGNASDYKLFLWDRDSLAPIGVSYNLSNGVAYKSDDGSIVAPFASYFFDEEDEVFIVSAISDDSIAGFKNDVSVTYQLSDSVKVLGLSDKLSDVTLGSTVLIGLDIHGNCAAIELLATAGVPFSSSTYESHYGFHSPSDGGEKYTNIVTKMFSRNPGGSKITFYQFNEDGSIQESNKTATFEQGALYRRVYLSKSESGDITVSVKSALPNQSTNLVESTVNYHNYLYLRYNTQTGKIAQCVVYCVPKNTNPGAGGDGWTDIFGLN